LLAALVADLGAIQRHMAQGSQPPLSGQSLKYLNKEPAKVVRWCRRKIAESGCGRQLVFSGQHAEVPTSPVPGFLEFLRELEQPYCRSVREAINSTKQSGAQYAFSPLNRDSFCLVDGVDRLPNQDQQASSSMNKHHGGSEAASHRSEGAASLLRYVIQGRRPGP